MTDGLTIEFRNSSNNVLYTGNLLKDVEGRSVAEGLTWSTKYPKGYSSCSFRFRPRDVFRDLPLTENHQLLIYDSGVQVYDGVIETISRNVNESDEIVHIQAVGPVSWINRRVVRATYVDDAPFERTTWPTGFETEDIINVASYERRFGSIKLSLGIGASDTNLNPTDDLYKELYEMPAGQGVRRITGNYNFRTGEALIVRFYNEDDDVTEFTVFSTQPAADTDDLPGETGSFPGTAFTSGFPRRMTFRFGPGTTDLFDANDIVGMENVVVYGAYQVGHPDFASPNYTQGELVEDLLRLHASEISSDYDLIGEPGQTLNPYIVAEPTPLSKIINEIASYGDASLNSWGFSIWGREETSDNKPKATFEQVPDTTDWEYVVRMSDDNLVAYSVTPATIDLHNYITVQYTDAQGATRFRDPADNANLTDTTSVNTYGRRDFPLKIGQATSALADQLGRRYLTYHKDPTYTGNVVLRGSIRTKAGHRQSLTNVRAGERYHVPELGQTFLIRQTTYNADSDQLTMSPGERMDNVDMFLTQRRRGLRG